MNSLLIFVIHETNGVLFFNINGLFLLSISFSAPLTIPLTVIVPFTNIYASE